MWLFLSLALAEQPAAPGAPPVPPPATPAGTVPPPVLPDESRAIDVSYSSDRVVTRVLPQFPDAAVNQGVRLGGCQVRFYVDEAGVPTRVLPVVCDDVFVEAAVTAGMQWRFGPYLEGGVPKKTKFNMVFIFEYQGRPVTPAK